ncbi:MAG: hypothetical protein LUG98_01825, partial [Tannerellaceae bacterium]|nr:hypothetical protein [Tannerellaceae bacterium]
MKFIIHPSFRQYESAFKEILNDFDKTGELVYKGRNLIKRFHVEGLDFTVKRFRIPHFINKIVYTTLRPSKAAR